MPTTIEAMTPMRMTHSPKKLQMFVPKAKKPPCIKEKAQINLTYSGSFKASFMFTQKGASLAFSRETTDGGN